MNMKKVLVIGASGFIGRKIFEKFSGFKNYLTSGTYHSRASNDLFSLDITNKVNVEKFIINFHPNIIFLPSALPNVDFCEDNKETAWKINVEGTRYVAKSAQKINAKLIFFSSDYVFDGKGGPYSEKDTPAPINFYGLTKTVGEGIVSTIDDYLILRMTVVYGWDIGSKNFIMQLINAFKNCMALRVPIDQYGTPILVDNLVDVLVELIERDKRGIYNLAEPDYVSRYEFAVRAAEILNLNKSLIVPTDTKTLDQRAARPLRGGLTIDKIKREINTKLLGIDEGIEIVKKQMGQYVQK